MRTREVTLNQGGTVLMTLLTRDDFASVDAPVRNFEGVQPPGSSLQAAFGTPEHRAGVLERDFAICGIDTYTTPFHALSVLHAALIRALSVRTSGWELPLAGPIGITEVVHQLAGLQVRLRLIPRSAFWRYLTGTKDGSGSQSGVIVTGTGFESTDVGRLLVWGDGREAQIIFFDSSTSVEVDVPWDATGSYTVYDAATGLL